MVGRLVPEVYSSEKVRPESCSHRNEHSGSELHQDMTSRGVKSKSEKKSPQRFCKLQIQILGC